MNDNDGDDNDGVTLLSIRHPVAPLWKRVWFRLFPPRLHAGALESVQIEILDPNDPDDRAVLGRRAATGSLLNGPR